MNTEILGSIEVNSLGLNDTFAKCLHPIVFVLVSRFIRVTHIDEKLPHGELVHERL